MITQLLAAFVTRAGRGDLPAPVIAAARRGLLDCLAVTLAGSREDVARLLARQVRAYASVPQSTVIRGDLRASAPLAAWANGAAAHALDYDDVLHIGSQWMGHPSVAVLPAALAVAEQREASGRALLLAYVTGLEIYAAVGLLCGDEPYRRGWHNTSYIGTMAAAGAVASLLGLDEAATRRCFGIAGSLAGGLRQNFGTMTKPLHAGIAARNGVEAGLLAAEGLTADESIFEAPLGFLSVFTGHRAGVVDAIPQGETRLTPDEFAARLGNPWRVSDPGLAFKICPSCRATHFGMDAALEFRQSGRLDPERIVAVECRVPRHMASVLFHHAPQTGLEGKFSLEYVMARALLDGVPKIGDFTDARVNEPRVRALMGRIHWAPFDPAAGTFGTPEFVLTLNDGGELRARVEFPRGDPENPVPDAVLIDKFDDCAGLVLPAEVCAQVRDQVMDLENLPRVTDLTRLLR